MSNASHGLPDLGVASLADFVEDARRITSATDLPVLSDIDTGFGTVLNIARTIREMERAGVAGVHIEDQELGGKRCGHRPGKRIVSTEEMVERVRAAVAARTDPDFVIMARTDAFASEGMEGTLDRCQAYLDAGADMLFPEAFSSLDQYRVLRERFPLTPILANMTEFGQTPLFTRSQLEEVGVSIIIYPLTVFRIMSRAAEEAYSAILTEGTQARLLPSMQTRSELYDILSYHAMESRLNR